MNNSDDVNDILHSSVGECQAKLFLISDYLERFKIKDMRIMSPIRDIERCVEMMAHVLHDSHPHYKGEGANFG